MSATPQYESFPGSSASLRRASAWLEQGDHARAYADALELLANDPADGTVVNVFVKAAACAERHDEAAIVLDGFGSRIPRVVATNARVSLALLAGDTGVARRLAESLRNDPAGAAMLPQHMIAIAEREDDPAAMLTWMRTRERATANVPFAWVPARWEVQGKLGQHDAVIAEASRLLAAITGFPAEQRIVRLHRAMAVHNALRFEDSLSATLGLIGEMVENRTLPATSPPMIRLGTRRRQAAVAAEIERLALVAKVPMAVHAGTLLALIREGDFFPFDQDFDLAAVPPATSADVADALIRTGSFRARPQAIDHGPFRSLGHVATGLAVDISDFERDGDRFVSVWRHPSGVVLRQAAVPAFSIRITDHAGIGRRLPMPSDPDAVLAATYGDWRTPAADFDTVVSAPNILHHTGFLHSVAAIRLADGLMSGRREQARHLARHLHRHQVAPELMERVVHGIA